MTYGKINIRMCVFSMRVLAYARFWRYLLLLPLSLSLPFSFFLFLHILSNYLRICPPPQSVWIHLFYSFVIVLWTDRLRFWILSKHFFSLRNTFFMWILNIYVYISGIFDNCRVNGQIITWFFDRNTFPIKSKSGIDKRHFKI